MSEPTATLPSIELEPDCGPADAAVIWLHGLGADGNDFVPIVPELRLPVDNHIRFVFPNAPAIPVTLNHGMVMPAWYDIRSLDSRGSDEAGIRRSVAELEKLVAREKARGIPASRIVIAGFSQGGAIALFGGLRHTERLAGILALSTYLLLPEKLDAEAAAPNADVPVLQCHGTHAPVVQEALGRAARDHLTRRGYDVTYEAYPMEHQVCLDEIQLIGAWLRARLPATP
jgi:phospholipase/carboxylesterase